MAKFPPEEDDAITVSARDWRAVREGETHAATRTSATSTPESLIVGVGASGTLLAGAAIVFITLVGLVSFNVWPSLGTGATVRNVELQAAKNVRSGGPVALVSGGSGQTATTELGAAGSQGGAGEQTGGGGKAKDTKQPPPNATPVSPPSGSEPGNGNGNRNRGGGNGNSGRSNSPSRASRSEQSDGPGNSNPAGHAASVSGHGRETASGDGGGNGRGRGGGSANGSKKAKGGGGASTTATGSGRNRQNPGRGH